MKRFLNELGEQPRLMHDNLHPRLLQKGTRAEHDQKLHTAGREWRQEQGQV